METNPFSHSLILTGPTGSGKTELAIELALRLDAEIVSMDSMALYRGMDIGTAKPSREQRLAVRHHLIDVLDPWESASVAWWLEAAKATVQQIEARGKLVLIVGGTPLYLKILLHGLFPGPPANEEIRSRLLAEASRACECPEEGAQLLHNRLGEVDPIAAARLQPQDLKRVIRALEVWELTGRPISAWQRQWNQRKPEGAPAPRVFCLKMPRAELYARIDRRVEGMFEEGLVAEVENLLRLPHPVSREAGQALGYKEVFAYLEAVERGAWGVEREVADDSGKASRLPPHTSRMASSLAETVRSVQTRSRNFAKRQLTWFRSLPECRWVSRELTFAALGLTMEG